MVTDWVAQGVIEWAADWVTEMVAESVTQWVTHGITEGVTESVLYQMPGCTAFASALVILMTAIRELGRVILSS
jgi:hypothetical protein